MNEQRFTRLVKSLRDGDRLLERGLAFHLRKSETVDGIGKARRAAGKLADACKGATDEEICAVHCYADACLCGKVDLPTATRDLANAAGERVAAASDIPWDKLIDLVIYLIDNIECQ